MNKVKQGNIQLFIQYELKSLFTSHDIYFTSITFTFSRIPRRIGSLISWGLWVCDVHDIQTVIESALEVIDRPSFISTATSVCPYDYAALTRIDYTKRQENTEIPNVAIRDIPYYAVMHSITTVGEFQSWRIAPSRYHP